MKPDASRGPAYRVETARLVMRCWAPADARGARTLMARNDSYLRRFIPFTSDEVRTVDEMVHWLRGHRAHFDRDEHYRYAVFAGDQLIGEAMLLDREQTSEREVGYWIDEAESRKGYATEAAAALVAVAFELDGVDEVGLNCSPTNRGSVAVAQKLGFTHLETRTRSDPIGPDDRESMRWVLSRGAYPASFAATLDVRAFDALDRSVLNRRR